MLCTSINGLVVSCAILQLHEPPVLSLHGKH